MNRRLTVAVALSAAAVTAVAMPSEAATKAKPKPIKGSYTLTLVPDPTPNSSAATGVSGCTGVIPQATDKHPFTAPAAGTIEVILDGDDPAKGAAPAGVDWDLYVNDAQGEVGASHGATAHEEVSFKVKKKTPLTFIVCNLAGLPNGKVSYTFTYK